MKTPKDLIREYFIEADSRAFDFNTVIEMMELYHNQFSTPKSEQEIEEMALEDATTPININLNEQPAYQRGRKVGFKNGFKAAHLSPDSDKWIRVESGVLPANDTVVIVYCPTELPDIGLRTLAYSVDGDWYSGTRLLNNKPTHWQPLPPAPKQ